QASAEYRPRPLAAPPACGRLPTGPAALVPRWQTQHEHTGGGGGAVSLELTPGVVALPCREGTCSNTGSIEWGDRLERRVVAQRPTLVGTNTHRRSAAAASVPRCVLPGPIAVSFLVQQ